MRSWNETTFLLPFSSLPPIVNRRMDEWVCLSRIDVGRGAVEEGPKELDFQLEAEFGRERKVTRNLKRKHDEINHVQKVYRTEGMIGEQGGRREEEGVGEIVETCRKGGKGC